MIREFLTRLRFFVRPRPQPDLDDELSFHLDQAIAARVAAGLSPEEARRQALIEFGGLERTREQCHQQRPAWWLGTVMQDARYALRGFRRNPVFTIAVILTLAIGIGATTAVFSVVDRILFRPLPYAHDDRLVSIGLVQPLQTSEFTLGGFFFDWQKNQKPFERITYESGYGDCTLRDASPIPLHCTAVAQNFLPTLGVAPVVGRNFTLAEDVPNGPQVAIISDGLWLSRFNRDPGVIGKNFDLDGRSTLIVGVLPKDFETPRMQPTEVLQPAQIDPSEQHKVNGGIGYPLFAFARLKPGVSLAQAQQQMEPLFLHTQQWIPAQFRNTFHLVVRSIRDRQMAEAYRAAWTLLGAAFVVLLIACANVASLFSARGAARQRELAVRSALGASRARLMRQTLTEAALLSLGGAAAGCLLAEMLLRLFIAVAPTGVPFLASARLDLRIVGFTVVVSFICSMLFSVLPALERPRTSALAARQARSAAHPRLRQVLVVVQIGLCVLLLCGASLLVKSFRNLAQQNLGMQTGNVITVHVPLNFDRYPHGLADFYTRAEAQFRSLPGVTAVGMSDSVPPSGWTGRRGLADLVPLGQPPRTERVPVVWRNVTPDYFRALQIPIAMGRNFTAQERTTNLRLCILSKSLAAILFPQGNAVGQKIEDVVYLPYRQPGPLYTVVGVAGEVRNNGLVEQNQPEFYALWSSARPEDWGGHQFFTIRTSLPVAAVAPLLMPLLRARIAQLDPTAPPDIDTMQQTLSRLADRPRFETALLGFFALCGLLMAVVGLYGVIAFIAAQRTQEIGVRMALGATRWNILRLIAAEGVRLIVLGGGLGLAGAFASAQLLKSLLFNVAPHDPVVYAAVAFLLALVALAATLIPARAAMKVEPVVALRYE